MKVLVISGVFPPMKSGGADFVLRLCSELVRRGVAVNCLTTSSKEPGTATDFEVLPLISEWNWRSMTTCLDVVKKLKPAVVNLHFTGWIYQDHPMVTFLPWAIKQYCPGTRVVTHLESLGGVQREKSSLVTAFIRRLQSVRAGRDGINYEYGTILRDSDRIIVLNERDKNELSRLYAPVAQKCLLIPPPPIMPISDAHLDKAGLRQALALDSSDFVISFYGYLYPGKGVENLFECVARLRSTLAVKLLLIGSVPEQYVLDKVRRPHYLSELKALARRLQIEENIVWAGYSPSESDRPSQLLRACDICVLPFERGVMLNNSSFSFAAAHALPIVTTKSAESEAVFVHEENVLFCQPGDLPGLELAIKRLAGDEQLCRRLSEGALHLSESWFSWESALNKTMSAYCGTDIDSTQALKAGVHAS